MLYDLQGRKLQHAPQKGIYIQNGQKVIVKYGAEPTDKEVLEFIDKNWHRLQFSQGVEAPSSIENRKNPKRQLREAKKQMRSSGIRTKSQQALKIQQEQNKKEQKQLSRAEREAEKQRRFDLRQAKKKEKHKGH